MICKILHDFHVSPVALAAISQLTDPRLALGRTFAAPVACGAVLKFLRGFLQVTLIESTYEALKGGAHLLFITEKMTPGKSHW